VSFPVAILVPIYFRSGRNDEREELETVSLASTSQRPAHPFERPEGYDGYRIIDPEGRKVGTVKELFKSADDGLDYVEIKMGFLGLQSVLIPVDLVAVDDERRALLLR
jgi:hypothetical protein